jgi:hypothetical protein
MRLAWICYTIDTPAEVTVVFKEPEAWRFKKIIPIVYAEIDE